ncbi:MAG: hypothetical protein ACLR0U_03005 [Enterocloster clostridioformis]
MEFSFENGKHTWISPMSVWNTAERNTAERNKGANGLAEPADAWLAAAAPYPLHFPDPGTGG